MRKILKFHSTEHAFYHSEGLKFSLFLGLYHDLITPLFAFSAAFMGEGKVHFKALHCSQEATVKKRPSLYTPKSQDVYCHYHCYISHPDKVSLL